MPINSHLPKADPFSLVPTFKLFHTSPTNVSLIDIKDFVYVVLHGMNFSHKSMNSHVPKKKDVTAWKARIKWSRNRAQKYQGGIVKSCFNTGEL